MTINLIQFSSQNRRTAYRHTLDDNAFSILYNEKQVRCLNISIQGCQIDYSPDLAEETTIHLILQHTESFPRNIQAQVIRIEDTKIALHFTQIDRETRITIEEYLLEIQKKELRFKKEKSIEENEKKLLST